MSTYTVLIPNGLAQSRARLTVDMLDDDAILVTRAEMIEHYTHPDATYKQSVVGSALRLCHDTMIEMLVMHHMLHAFRVTHPTLGVESHVDRACIVTSNIPIVDCGWD